MRDSGGLLLNRPEACREIAEGDREITGVRNVEARGFKPGRRMSAIDQHTARMADRVRPKTRACTARTASTRGRLTAPPPKAVAFGVAPVALALDAVPLALEDGPVQANVTARLHDFGVVSLSLRVPVAGLSWFAFTRLLNAVDRVAGPLADSDLWERLLAEIRAVLDPAFIRPNPSMLEEDYPIGAVNAFDQRLAAAALQERIDLVPLLSGEQRPLSETARQDLLRQRFSYYTNLLRD